LQVEREAPSPQIFFTTPRIRISTTHRFLSGEFEKILWWRSSSIIANFDAILAYSCELEPEWRENVYLEPRENKGVFQEDEKDVKSCLCLNQGECVENDDMRD
jgi:hypothetical protein